MTAVFDDTIYKLKMDVAAWRGELILRKAINENRGLSALESAGVKLATMDRNHIWSEWIAEAKSAGRYVSQWDREYVAGRKSGNGLRVTNATGTRPTLFVYGVIGANLGGVSAEDFRQAIDQVPDAAAISIRIHSDGGSFTDSIAIYSSIRRRSGESHVIVDGAAYSGASVIAQAGDTIEMAEGSWMMIHEASGSLDATADGHREAAERLDRVNDQLAEIYAKRWKGTERELRAALKSEKWMADHEAVKAGLADFVGDGMAVAAHVDPGKFKYRNTPATLAISASAHADRIQLRRRLAELGLHRACI